MTRKLLKSISRSFKSIKRFKEIAFEKISPGKQISLIRNALGMTQGQLAKRIGLSSYVPVAKIEAEEYNNPTLKTLEKYAEALGCTLFIKFIPNEEIEKVVERKALEKAKEIISLSSANSAMEIQSPEASLIKEEIEELKLKLLNKKKKGILWED